MARSVDWHRCSRWWRAGVLCPFDGVLHQAEEPDHDDDDDGAELPKFGIPQRVPRKPPPSRMTVQQVANANIELWRRELRAIAPEQDYLRVPVAPQVQNRRRTQRGAEGWIPHVLPAALALMLAAGLAALLGGGTGTTATAGSRAERQLAEAFRTQSARSNLFGGQTVRGRSSSPRRPTPGFADNYWQRLGLLPRMGLRRVKELNSSDVGFSDPFGGLV